MTKVILLVQITGKLEKISDPDEAFLFRATHVMSVCANSLCEWQI